MPVHDWLRSKFDSMSSNPSPRKKMLSRKRRGGGHPKDSSSLTSSVHSIGEDAPAEAPWRVENIRTQGAPSEADWWKNSAQTSSLTEKDGGKCKSADDDGDEDTGKEENGHMEQSGTATAVAGTGGEFHNCGLETWEAARRKWKVATVQERPPHPPPVRYDEVVRGLTQVVRTYELPGRMTLPDIVDVFVDIWECEKDY